MFDPPARRDLTSDPSSNTAFEIVLDRVVEARAPVFGDHFVIRVSVLLLLGHDALMYAACVRLARQGYELAEIIRSGPNIVSA